MLTQCTLFGTTFTLTLPHQSPRRSILRASDAPVISRPAASFRGQRLGLGAPPTQAAWGTLGTW